MKRETYDTIVIGAGIAGCCVAYFLKKRGLSLLVLDRSGVAATGGSAAAGAFVSPKIGKGSPLQSLTNEAFDFAKDFYLQNFPQYFSQTGVIRIPKDEDDAKKFIEYEAFNRAKREWVDEDALAEYGIKNSHKSFLFDEAGVCDAQSLCKALLQDISYKQVEVGSLSYEDDWWFIGDIQAKKVVLATGYENKFFDMRYMGVRGTWGSRGDYETAIDLAVSMHKQISVSANINGIVKLGATHEKGKEPCMICDGEPLKKLFETASTMVDTSDFELKETFCGMRSGSKDYFPLLGEVVNTSYMLQTHPKILKGAKPPLEKIENLYICNGLGGRGFVFAPLMAQMLAELMVDDKAVDKRVNPDRLFLKWCRKSPELKR